MEWKEIAQKINTLSQEQARLALLLVLNALASEQELDSETLQGFLEIAETWPKESS